MSEEYEKYHQQFYSELKYKNPFHSRLNSDADIKPKKRKLFVEKITDNKTNDSKAYSHKIDFSYMKLDDANLEIYYEEGKEKINLDLYVEFLTNFFCNYSPLEFPVFCLNFDYMRVLSTLLQRKLEEFLIEYSKLDELYIEIKTNYEDLVKKNTFNGTNNRKKEKFSERERTSKSKKSSNADLFYLSSNIFNDNKINNSNSINSNMVNTANKEYSSIKNNLNPDIFTNNYQPENFKNELDLKNIRDSSKSPSNYTLKTFTNNNAVNINIKPISLMNKLEKNETEKILKNNEKEKNSLQIQSKNSNNTENNFFISNNNNNNTFNSNNNNTFNSDYNSNSKLNIDKTDNQRYNTKLDNSSEELSKQSFQNGNSNDNEVNKNVYYHTFSNNINSINNSDRMENMNLNSDDIYNPYNSTTNNYRGNTDSFNINTSKQNNKHDNAIDLKKIINLNFQMNNEDFKSQYKNQYKRDKTPISSGYELNNEKKEYKNINDYDYNINRISNESSNIKEKLINNLFYINQPNNDRKSKINELSTLQSNDFIYGDNSYNDFSSRFNRYSTDKSPKFIQSLDGDIGFDYANRSKRDDNSEILSKNENLNSDNNNYNSLDYFKFESQEVVNKSSKIKIRATDKKYQNYKYADRIMDGSYLLFYLFKGYFSKIIFKKLKFNLFESRLKKFNYTINFLLRQKQRKLKMEAFKLLKIINRPDIDENRILELSSKKQIRLKKKFLSILINRINIKKYAFMVKSKFAKKNIFKYLKGISLNLNLRKKQNKQVYEFFRKTNLKRIFRLLKVNIFNNKIITQKDRINIGQSSLSKFESATKSNFDYFNCDKKEEIKKNFVSNNNIKIEPNDYKKENYDKIFTFFHGDEKKNLFSNNLNNINNIKETCKVLNSNINNNDKIFSNNNLTNPNNNVSDINSVNLIEYSKLSNDYKQIELEKDDFDLSHGSSENPYKYNYNYEKKQKDNYKSKAKKERNRQESILKLKSKELNSVSKSNDNELDNLLDKLQEDYKNLGKCFFNIFLILISFK